MVGEGVDLLLPRTDAGVLVQLVVVAIAWIAGYRRVRNDPDARLLMVGVGVVLLAFFGVRALH